MDGIDQPVILIEYDDARTISKCIICDAKDSKTLLDNYYDRGERFIMTAIVEVFDPAVHLKPAQQKLI